MKKYLFVIDFDPIVENYFDSKEILSLFPQEIDVIDFEYCIASGPGDISLYRRSCKSWINNDYFSVKINNRYIPFKKGDEELAKKEWFNYLNQLIDEKFKDINSILGTSAVSTIDELFSEKFIKEPKDKNELKKLTQKQQNFISKRNDIKTWNSVISNNFPIEKMLSICPSFSSLAILLKRCLTIEEFNDTKSLIASYCLDHQLKVIDYKIVCISEEIIILQ